MFGLAIRVFILILIVTGIAYPLTVVAIDQSLFPFQSNGSLVTMIDGSERQVGSILIAQKFKSKFFHPRAGLPIQHQVLIHPSFLIMLLLRS